MNATIFMFLVQDGVTSGAIYAMMALALVLIFAVTRVLFIPQGEFVAFGALTYGVLQTGHVPGIVWVLVAFGGLAFVARLWQGRHMLSARRVARAVALDLLLPSAIVAIAFFAARLEPPASVCAALTILIVTPLGPYLYRFAFQPMAELSILELFIAAVAVHFSLTGIALLTFGAEGFRATPLSSTSFTLGPLVVSSQSLWIYGFTAVVSAALFLFFKRTIWGKALAATAVNRLGARLIGIPTVLSGELSFGFAAFLGAASGVLIAPVTTIYYDSGFLIGLKGFVAATMAGLASFPGSALAGLAVGLIEAFASFLASDFKEIIVFMMILPVLLWLSFTHVIEDEE